MTAVLTRTLSPIIFICLMLMAAYPVWAQDATTSSTTRKDKVEQRVETRKEKVTDRITAMKERAATKEAALKQRLSNFKNKVKAQTAERINAMLTNINEKITANMKKHLEKMTQLLSKLEKRVDANASLGDQSTSDIKDPAKTREAIASAKDKIAAAQAAVSAQMDKDYVIVATSEATIRADAQAAREQLHADLKSVRQLAIVAKQSVSNAIRVAKSNKGETSNGQ